MDLPHVNLMGFLAWGNLLGKQSRCNALRTGRCTLAAMHTQSILQPPIRLCPVRSRVESRFGDRCERMWPCKGIFRWLRARGGQDGGEARAFQERAGVPRLRHPPTVPEYRSPSAIIQEHHESSNGDWPSNIRPMCLGSMHGRGVGGLYRYA